ncbi:helix-turn-helix domain-containing protein [Massilia sp. YIM B02763]|uniref:helix-turn-helix domain-containing protein n=1 Tax=Massilia sp. YIM B02763 TaxID=3050130 RepID=UPI0025B6E024|nr:helix-turn-helix domain-containing protein [Massilia sp. YIM B02763]MDN4054633.1 helix-turn-helix domain-containing protein [Massilia sp. YIM B02763]
MTAKKTDPKSARLAAMHASAAALHSVGAMDDKTMRHFEALCLQPVANLAPEEIKTIRVENKLSQALFARLINTSASTVQKWESGQKHPSGLALKMLQVVKNRGIEVLMV